MRSSPRPWGCFYSLTSGKCEARVFPTPVGVFLFIFPQPALRGGLPHVRGGVSKKHGCQYIQAGSSPRPWGCFRHREQAYLASRVFPTPVGVFLRAGQKIRPVNRSSPRPWGCFPLFVDALIPNAVFPTPVGVFPPGSLSSWQCASLPHARGGVSQDLCWSAIVAESSPRPWGCFSGTSCAFLKFPVFPTPVGVFPAPS